jgi:hypothetical protein
VSDTLLDVSDHEQGHLPEGSESAKLAGELEAIAAAATPEGPIDDRPVSDQLGFNQDPAAARKHRNLENVRSVRQQLAGQLEESTEMTAKSPEITKAARDAMPTRPPRPSAES